MVSELISLFVFAWISRSVMGMYIDLSRYWDEGF